MTDAMPILPTYTLDGNVAVIGLDDGKANAVSPAVLHALSARFDQAKSEARAVVLVGRPGKFSAGFDLSVMTESEQSMRALVSDGAEFLCQVSEFPLPVVSACSGHALAMGALILLASDIRVGAEGPFKLGLTEVAIGMPLPIFVIEFARSRLTAAEFTRATLGAKVYDPEGAVTAGYLDRVVPVDELMTVAMEEARTLGAYRTGAYSRSKYLAHRGLTDLVRSTLVDDMATLVGPAK